MVIKLIFGVLDLLRSRWISSDVKREPIFNALIRDRVAYAGDRDGMQPHAIGCVVRSKKSSSRRVTLEAL